MKKLKTVCSTFILVFLLLPSLVTAQYHIPDSIFREVLHSKYGITFDNLNNITNPEKAATVERLHLNNTNHAPDNTSRISSLEGIGAFTSLTFLSCANNRLLSLDLSNNPKLTTLKCNSNQLITLNVFSNPELLILHCDNNNLESLDLSRNPELTTLKCNSNQLITLNVFSNPELLILHCNNNNLESLDLSSNTKITDLYCGSNPFESLDLSSNLALSVLNCPSNNLSSLDLSSNYHLFTLDVNNSSKLSKIKLHSNREIISNYNATPFGSRKLLKKKMIFFSILLIVVLVGIFLVYLLFKPKVLAIIWAGLKNVNFKVKVAITFFILALIPSILMLPRVLKPGTPNYYYTTVPYIIFMIYFLVTAFILNLKDNNPKRNMRLNFLILITSAIVIIGTIPEILFSGGKLEAAEMFLALIVAPILILINVVLVITKIILLSKQRINKN